MTTALKKFHVMLCEKHVTIEAETEAEALDKAASEIRSGIQSDDLIAWEEGEAQSNDAAKSC